MTASVTRYVATFVNRHGVRTLMRAAQGRNTFDTAKAAQEWIDEVTCVNSADTIRQVYGDDPRFEVRPCDCWPVHHDPKSVWFD